jgi:hypothetical protein
MKLKTTMVVLLAFTIGILAGIKWRSGRLEEDAATPPLRIVDAPQITRILTNAQESHFAWPLWRTGSLKEFAEQLRGIDCPETFLQDIVIAEINKEAAQSIIQNTQTSNSPSFASNKLTTSSIRSGRISQITQVLGLGSLEVDFRIGLPYVEPRDEPTVSDNSVSHILRKKSDRIKQIMAQTHGFVTQEDKKLIEEAEQAAQVEIRQAMTPEEFRQYETDRFKETEFGGQLMANFGVSDNELDAVRQFMKAQEGLDSAPDRDAAQERNQASLAAILGKERFQVFMQSIDPGYREAVAFSQRFGLDPSVADAIMQLRKEAMWASIQINSPSFDPNQVSRSFKAKDQAIRESLSQLVGSKAADIYIRDAKLGNWAR